MKTCSCVVSSGHYPSHSKPSGLLGGEGRSTCSPRGDTQPLGRLVLPTSPIPAAHILFSRSSAQESGLTLSRPLRTCAEGTVSAAAALAPTVQPVVKKHFPPRKVSFSRRSHFQVTAFTYGSPGSLFTKLYNPKRNVNNAAPHYTCPPARFTL